MNKQCTHYWILPTPNGSTVEGECKYCRERKEFSTHLDSEMGSYWKQRNEHNWASKQNKESVK